MLILVPRLAIGSAKLNQFKALQYNTYSYNADPVVAAFRSSVPMIKESDDGNPSLIAAALGEHQRAGVLYLELSQELADDAHANPMLYFKAIRQAFNDCLNLD